MTFPRKPKAEMVLPTEQDSKNNVEEKRQGSGLLASPVSKPTPTRLPSIRVQEQSYTSQQTASQRDIQQNASLRSTQTTGQTQRPGLQRRRTTARTRYIDMLLGLDAVSPVHNILASLSVWILLAGYIVFPATFTKLQSKDAESKADTEFTSAALRTVRNVPLLYVAAFACGVGVLGCLWLWYQHRKNYVWVINRIFLPALLNSVAGLISTIVNVYSAQEGHYSVTARVTIIVTSACSVVAAALFLLYNMVMLKLVRRKHEKEVKAAERDERRWLDGGLE